MSDRSLRANMQATILVGIGYLLLAVGNTEGNSELDVPGSRSSGDVRHRSKRYLVFPEGSTFLAGFCVTIKSTTGPDDIFTEGVNWALSFDLPNETIHDREMRYEFPVILRRHRRDLYVKMEKLMDSAGVDGRECILKTICEAGQQLVPRKGILEEVMRILFVNSRSRNEIEPDSVIHGIYYEAYERGLNNDNCNDLYSCPFSVLDLWLSFGEFSHLSQYPY